MGSWKGRSAFLAVACPPSTLNTLRPSFYFPLAHIVQMSLAELLGRLRELALSAFWCFGTGLASPVAVFIKSRWLTTSISLRSFCFAAFTMSAWSRASWISTDVRAIIESAGRLIPRAFFQRALLPTLETHWVFLSGLFLCGGLVFRTLRRRLSCWRSVL